MLAVAMEHKNIPKLLKKRQKHSRWFVALLVVVLMFVEGKGHNSIVYEIMEPVGALFIAICIVGRGYCSAYIGGIKNDMLMREGPFSVVRNPLYVFSFIGLFGVGMLSGMVTFLTVLVVAFMVYYFFVIAREEAFLADKFGEDYKRYLQEVPRWFPKWSLWHEPQELVVRPRFVRRTMMDGLLFLLPFSYFEILEILHERGVLPVLVWLP
jgi:protein-S-isoprenylcysteine O-methyltransferase Ste14